MGTTAERQIRKYRNRKLYDQGTHTYITLSDIRKLYQSGDPIKILDYNDQDITENIVIQSVIQNASGDRKLKDLILSYARENT
jgi:polyhydroxyalkanoate synthesis regulator protein